MASNTSARADAAGEPPVDVLVVGAGPGGSAVATHLARLGLDVTVVDRAAFPRDKACSEYMSPETVRLLDGLGVVAALEAAGAMPLAGTEVTAARGNRLHGRFALAGAAPFRSTGLSLSRRILDHVLVGAARAAGARVLERTTVEALQLEDGAVAGAVVRDAEGRRRTVRARLTVGADGLRSVVARQLGRRRHGRPRRMAFVAHVDGVSGMSASAELHVGARGYVGLNRIGPDRTNVALVVPAERAAEAAGRTEPFFLEAMESFPGVAGRLSGGTVSRKVMATGPFAAWSRRVTADGAALVGDAADFFDPFTGEGIYSALHGAALLAEAAAEALRGRRGPVPAHRLAGYRQARRRAFAGKWAVERLIGYGMLWPALFDHAVARLGRRPGMADTLVGVTGEIVPARRVLNPLFLARMLV
ncbi:MAG TPA: NAD(P)/FAD-dependent oxidoreductase [Gemmatimonadales bacterium]|nr:NAD(P)/FAD-dependent oxidoreductase [Gemmatimonadales bacterium]